MGSRVRLLVGLLLASLAMSDVVQAQTNLTVNANSRLFIGGTGTLDRAQYFNHWGQVTPGASTNLGDLETEIHSPTGLHSFSGRETNDLWVAMMQQWNVFSPEDPNNPGFFDEAAIVSKMQNNTNTWGYKYRVLQDDLWDSLRDAENPIYITSGRKGLYPDFIDSGTDMVTNYAGFADFINIYLRELVYGTGPGQGYLPFDKDRFYVEVMNEPQWSNDATWNEVIALHRNVTELVKEQHPEAKIGGASCCGRYNSTEDGWQMAKQMMEDMTTWETPSGQSVKMDFWSIHPYERYALLADGTYEQDNFFSPGHLAGTMDLLESYSNQLFGEPISIAATEYGSWQQLRNGGSYSSYPRDLQQWDLVRNVREKLMVFMERPDRIINATPFLAPRHWESTTPTPDYADNVFWEQDAAGDWHETIVASMYRMYNDLSGEYLDIGSDNPDVQTVGFRDGNQVYVVLNNLETSSESVNLAALLGAGNSVTSASIDRIHRTGGVNTYEQGVDVTATWQNMTLAPEEGAVLTLTLAGSTLYDIALDQRTFYGDVVDTPLNISGGRSETINIGADLEGAQSARVRVSYNREGVGTAGEGFFVFVNNNLVVVPAETYSFDDNDPDVVSREVEVPLNFLLDGNNELVADFVGDGGQLISAVLEVTRSVGDFNASGAFDGEDLSLLVKQFGPVAVDSKYDLVADGMVDLLDVDYWLSELRGTTAGLGDFDLDNDIDADDLAVWESNYGSGSHYGQGDLDFDGDVDGFDFLALQKALSGFITTSVSSTASIAVVPEPHSIFLLISSISLLLCRRSA